MLRTRPWLRIVIGIVMLTVGIILIVLDGIRISSVGFLVVGGLHLYYGIQQRSAD